MNSTTLSNGVNTPLSVHRSTQPQRTLSLTNWLVLGLSLALAGCVGVVDPRQTASAKAPVESGTPTTANGSSTSSAPASANKPVAAPAPVLTPILAKGPLSPIGEGKVSTRSIATLAAPVDIWDRIRRGFALTDLSTDEVRDKEQWYANRPDYIQRMTGRSSRYLFHIVEEVERRGLPSELALLPFIESAFNPQAVSSARAAGMWQFMPATGESFDLRQNAFRDDRRDVLASTTAALDYLEQLHGRFGDWHLALAAYNWGQGNVNRAITRNQKAGLPAGYLDLDMPLETRQYVPKLQAVKNIVAFPDTFSIELSDIGNHPYFDAISISNDIDVAVITQLAEIEEKDFRALNPSIKQPVVMAAGTPQILLPWDNANLFEQRLNGYSGQLASWTAWVVPSTMSPAEVAKRVNMSESELRRVNNIPPRMNVRSGSSLLVRRSAHATKDVSEHVADNASISLQPDVVWRKTTVRVRSGENLYSLAKRYGVSVSSIASLNKVSSKSKLRKGQRIALMLPYSPGSKVKVSRASSQEIRDAAASSKANASSRQSGSKSKVQVSTKRKAKTKTKTKSNPSSKTASSKSKLKVAKKKN